MFSTYRATTTIARSCCRPCRNTWYSIVAGISSGSRLEEQTSQTRSSLIEKASRAKKCAYLCSTFRLIALPWWAFSWRRRLWLTKTTSFAIKGESKPRLAKTGELGGKQAYLGNASNRELILFGLSLRSRPFWAHSRETLSPTGRSFRSYQCHPCNQL